MDQVVRAVVPQAVRRLQGNGTIVGMTERILSVALFANAILGGVQINRMDAHIEFLRGLVRRGKEQDPWCRVFAISVLRGRPAQAAPYARLDEIPACAQRADFVSCFVDRTAQGNGHAAMSKPDELPHATTLPGVNDFALGCRSGWHHLAAVDKDGFGKSGGKPVLGAAIAGETGKNFRSDR